MQESTTYEQLYIHARNAHGNEATYAWHMLGKKLRNDEDPKKSLKLREILVSKLFAEKFPHAVTKNLENDVYKARRIYDVTRILSGNQILSIKKITADHIRRVAKKNITKVVNYCK
jgi:hypothetical protein